MLTCKKKPSSDLIGRGPSFAPHDGSCAASITRFFSGAGPRQLVEYERRLWRFQKDGRQPPPWPMRVVVKNCTHAYLVR